MTEDRRSGTDRRKRGRPNGGGGRRDTDPIYDLATHKHVYVSVAQLADYWGKDAETLRLYCRKGRLPAIKVGGDFRIRSSDAIAFEQRDPAWQRRETQ